MNDEVILDECEKCLAVIHAGWRELDFAKAETLFQVALVLAGSIQTEQGRDLAPLAIYHLSLLRKRQGRLDDSRRLREEAAKRLQSEAASREPVLFQHLMLSVLMELGEYRGAIPFCEQAIQLELESKDAVLMADLLWRTGQCYSLSGLRDHATVPLRAAVKIFRNYPSDPRFPAVLLALGNVLRKSSPNEAEAYYREAVELHEGRGQLESVTPAWVNLGVLCSEQGRHEESLAFYKKALRVREQSPGTSPARMGSLQNNIANCYRRMRNFPEALQAVDRAIPLLERDGGPVLAAAYGTRGLIFRDDGKDAEAVEWLRKAYSVHEKLPSPNLETMAEDLENEAAALKRLGRTEEAGDAEARLESVRGRIKGVPSIDRDLSALSAGAEGAMLIELGLGSRPGSAYPKGAAARLGEQLAEAVGENHLGFYGGHVVIPESTTLMFYGEDGEALFRVTEPILRSEKLCAGARVTIRQGGKHREVILPSRVM
jgi:tetratricopeptide (TPR) repeat protein